MLQLFKVELFIWVIFIFLLLFLITRPNASCIDGTPLSKAFFDPAPFMTSILCSIVVCSTTALELLLDIIFKSDLSKVNDTFERFMLFLIVMIPGFSILKAAHTPEIASVFCSWHMFHFMGSLAPVYSICCKFVPDHFSGIQLPLSYSFWVLSGIISLWGVQGPLGTWRLILVAGLGTLSQAIFLCAIYRWGKSLHGRAESKKLRFPRSLVFNVMEIMSEDEFCCALYVLFGFPIYTGFASLAGCLKFSWANCNRDELLSGVYIFICFTILTSCIPGRAKQYASKIQKQKIGAGHTTIRYISHEIRSPLNIVQNGIKLLIRELHGKCSNDVFENLLDVQHASDAATLIVDDLLDFEKIQSGKFVLNQKFVSVSACVTKIAESCRSLARLKGIHFFVHDCITQNQNFIHTAHIDVFKLEQVIRNLITNSIKFTEPGGSISVYLRHSTDFLKLAGNDDRNSSTHQSFHTCNRVFKAIGWCYHRFVGLGTQKKRFRSSVYATSQAAVNFPVMSKHQQNIFRQKKYNDDKDGCIIIEVADTGVGMSSEQAANVFGEFVQFDPNRLQGGGGSGLGLWICKEIIKAHGGSICVHSEGVGTGTKVSLKLHCYIRKNVDEELGNNCDSSAVCSVQQTIPHAKMQNEGSNFASALHYDIDSRSTQSFPFVFCSVEEEKLPLDTLVNTISPPITTRKLCLLIVDDSALNRKFLIKTIKSLQDSLPIGVVLHFLEADNGASALQLMKSHSECIEFDAVFLDNIMPYMNGPQAAEAMRNELNFQGRIIGVTGNGLDSDILDFKMHGANEVLVKPVCWGALKSELEVLLGPANN